jgi:hypothetical protein
LVIRDPLQPLIQPTVGIVNVRIGPPQRLASVKQKGKSEHGRVRWQIHRFPVVGFVGSRENDPMIEGFTDASVERTKQTKGFVEHSSD